MASDTHMLVKSWLKCWKSDFKWHFIALFPVQRCKFCLFGSQHKLYSTSALKRAAEAVVNQCRMQNLLNGDERTHWPIVRWATELQHVQDVCISCWITKNLPFLNRHKTLKATRSAATEGGHLNDSTTLKSVHKPSDTHCADTIPSFSWHKEPRQVTLVTLNWASTERYRQSERERSLFMASALHLPMPLTFN